MKPSISKKTILFCFLFLTFFAPLALHAKEHSSQKTELNQEKVDSKNVAIHTYGGGESLGSVFRAISMLIYGNSSSGVGKTFEGILRIVLIIGGFAAVLLAFSKENFNPLIKGWLLPTLFITGILLVPRKTIYIQDHLIPKSADSKYSALIKVDDVPFFLAEFASLTSTLSYKFTGALEDVAHGVNDSIYNWTGHIYAGETLFQAGKVKINNSLVEENLRSYCRECVYRDIGIGIYTKDELKAAPDLFAFLTKHASHLRSVRFRSDDGQVQWIPCSASIKHIKERFDQAQVGGPLTKLKGQEVGNAPEILFGEIGNETSFLLSQSAQGKDQIKNLMKQQIAIDFLQEEIPGTLNSFAVKRAELLAQSNEKILGAKGVRSVVKMRNFFEGAIYIVFPLVIIFALIPSWGIKALVNWLQFVLWINIWPPFYVAINFFLSGDWKFNLARKFGTKTLDLTLFTSSGLSDLYSSMETTAAVALFFTPFISWAIMKGGVGSMVHLASSLSAPDQSSAATSAQEQTSGNYTFGQTSFDNKSLYNDSRFKQDVSPQLRSGTVSLSQGLTDVSYSPQEDRFMMKQGKSQFRDVDLSQNKAFSQSFQNQLHKSENLTREKSFNLSDSVSQTTNSALGFVESLSEGTQLGAHLSHQGLTSWQELTSNTQTQLDDYCHTWGVDHRQAIEEAVRVSVGLPVIGGSGVSGSQSVGKLSSDQMSQRMSDAESLSKNFQELSQYSTSDLINDTTSKDARSHLDFTKSWNKTQTEGEQLRIAQTNQEAWSEIVSGVHSHSLSLGENLNDRYVDFLMDKHHHDPKEVQRILDDSDSFESRQSIESFIGERLDPLDVLRSQVPEQVSPPDFKERYTNQVSEEKKGGLFLGVNEEIQKAENQGKPLDREAMRSELNAFEKESYQRKQQFEVDQKHVIPSSERENFQGLDSQTTAKEKIRQASKDQSIIEHAGNHLVIGKVASAIFSQNDHFRDLEGLGLTDNEKIAIIDSRISDYFP
jgi:conjugal transfer mating pair stabilization protein TraG